MLVRRIFGLFRILVLLQVALAGVLYWGLWILMERWVYVDGLDSSAYVRYGAIALAALLAEATTRGQARQQLLDMDRGMTLSVSVKQLIFVTFGILLFVVFAKDQIISRGFLSAFLILLLILLVYTNSTLPHFLARHSFWRLRRTQIPTVVAGSAEQIERFSRWVVKGRALGMRIVGLVSNDSNDALSKRVSWRRLGDFKDVDRVLGIHGAQQLIVLGLPEEMRHVRELVAACEHRGIRFLMLNDLGDQLGRNISTQSLNGKHLMVVYEEPLEDPLNQAFKRGLDIGISSLILLTVVPIAAIVVWMIHRLQSPGPLFYTQERSGLQGQPFRIWKFRSLHAQPHNEAKQVTQHDSRVFSGGRWMRKFCIDELPQFWNVLMGDMSLVGPRPHLIAHDHAFARVMANYKIRTFVKPGITGLAQVSGFRGETQQDGQIIDRVRCDISYLENWSLGMDFRILFLTAFHVAFPPKTAY